MVWQNVFTSSGSNWVPEQRFNSSNASCDLTGCDKVALRLSHQKHRQWLTRVLQEVFLLPLELLDNQSHHNVHDDVISRVDNSPGQ